MDKSILLLILGAAVVGGGAYALAQPAGTFTPVQSGFIPRTSYPTGSGQSTLEQVLLGTGLASQLLPKIGQGIVWAGQNLPDLSSISNIWAVQPTYPDWFVTDPVSGLPDWSTMDSGAWDPGAWDAAFDADLFGDVMF
jgi:hypothetical protein